MSNASNATQERERNLQGIFCDKRDRPCAVVLHLKEYWGHPVKQLLPDILLFPSYKSSHEVFAKVAYPCCANRESWTRNEAYVVNNAIPHLNSTCMTLGRATLTSRGKYTFICTSYNRRKPGGRQSAPRVLTTTCNAMRGASLDA